MLISTSGGFNDGMCFSIGFTDLVFYILKADLIEVLLFFLRGTCMCKE